MTTLVQTEIHDIAARFPGSVVADPRPNYSGWIVDKDCLLYTSPSPRD